MPSSNVDIFSRAMARVKDKITDMLVTRYFPKAHIVAKTAHDAPPFKNFTGNAITSYMAYAFSPTKYIKGYDSLSGARPPLRAKVAYNEDVDLPRTYDGRENKHVHGAVRLSSSSSLDALTQMLSQRRLYSDYFLTIRIGHPVEYEKYLARKSGTLPIVAMHNAAMVRIK